MKTLNQKSVDEIISSATLTKDLDYFKITVQWDKNDADYLTETFKLRAKNAIKSFEILGFWATFPKCMDDIEIRVSKEFYEFLNEKDWIHRDSESGRECHSIDKIDIIYINELGVTYEVPLELFKVEGISQEEYENYLMKDSEE